MTAPAYYVPTNVDPTSRALPRRYGAYIIDTLLSVVIVLFAIGGFFALSTTRTVEDANTYCDSAVNPTHPIVCFYENDTQVRVLQGGQLAELIIVGGALGALVAANQWVLQGITGATVGKHMLGLRVVKPDGTKVGFWANALRTLLLFVDAACYGIPGIISVSVTHPHRRIGDMAANTYVVPLDALGTPVPTSQQLAYGAQPYGYQPYGYGATPPPPPPPVAPQPQWDGARGAWVILDPRTGTWQQWDANSGQWGPLAQ
jgi:hypothetical protein